MQTIYTVTNTTVEALRSGTSSTFLLASVSYTRAYTLSSDSYCRPTAGKSSKPSRTIYSSICVRRRLPLHILFAHAQVSR
jgi:hypothetical protein